MRTLRYIAAYALVLGLVCGAPLPHYSTAEAAIAYDTSSSGDSGGSFVTSLTVSHTMGTAGSIGCGVVVDSLTAHAIGGMTATYNGVSMTQKFDSGIHSSQWEFFVFTLANPASGAHNTVASTVSGNPQMGLLCTSYTGTDQTTNPDAVGSASGSSGTQLSSNVTTTKANDWVAAYSGVSIRSMTVNTNLTQRAQTSNVTPQDVTALFAGDSNAAVSVGSYNQILDYSGNIGGGADLVQIAFEPVQPVTPKKVPDILKFE